MIHSHRETPLVSVVIPVHNGEAFIAVAILSVLGQTYQALECLVVDDGSTDGTVNRVRGFGDAIRVVAKENAGVSSARNAGAAVARGEYLAFLDSDDVWLPKKLEVQMEIFRQRPDLGLTYTGYWIADEALKHIRAVGVPDPADTLRNLVALEPPGIHIALTGVMPASIFQALGGFDERLSTSADLDLACRIAIRYEVRGEAKPLALYRQHPGQMRHDTGTMEKDVSLVFEKLFTDRDTPGEVLRLRNRAHANLYSILGVSALRRGHKREGTRWLLRSLRHHPGPLWRIALRQFRRSEGKST
jgi:glycosyltransferase involved in cell wall biosynthesis